MAMNNCHVAYGGQYGGKVPTGDRLEEVKEWFKPIEVNVERERFSGRLWFNRIIVWLLFVTFVSFIVTIFVLLVPGFEVRQYEPAECHVTKMVYDGDQDCSCGKNCRSSFPCFKLTGTMSILDGDNVTMSFYSNYYDARKECSFVECSNNEEDNTSGVIKEAVEFFEKFNPSLDSTDVKTMMTEARATGEGTEVDLDISTELFDCHGKDDTALWELLKSTVFIVCGFIPLMVFLPCLIIFMRFGSPAFRRVCVYILCWPFCFLLNKDKACKFCKNNGPCHVVF